MITAIQNKNLYFSRQDVEDAEWIIQTSNQLDHGIEPLLWAWKVVNWYLNFYTRIKKIVLSKLRQGIKVDVQSVVTYVAKLVKSNKILV